MQYHQNSRSRMPPFARGGAYSRGPKQLYPPLPPPPSAAPTRKYEVLMEAGRLAAEYLVAKGVLPPTSLQRRGGGGRWGPPPPQPPPLPPMHETPVFYHARSGRRRFDDEDTNPSPRSRRNSVSNNSDSSHYSGRGKRKFGAYDDKRGRERERERSRGHSDSRSYEEDDEGGASGYRRVCRGIGGNDEVGSSVSGVAEEGQASKVEAMGESELEDTGSRASSTSNVRKEADALLEVEGENEANKILEDSKVSNSEVVEQGMNGNSNNASCSGVEEVEMKHSLVHLDDKISDEKAEDDKVLEEKPEDDKVLEEKPEDDKVLEEKPEDDMTSEEKVSSVENNMRDNCRNFLNNCNFAKVPTRPRSVLTHRNAAPSQREIAVPEQVDLVSTGEATQMVIDEAANHSSLTNIQADNIDNEMLQEHADPSTVCNQVVESVRLQEMETSVETEDMGEQNSILQNYAVQESKEHTELSPTMASHENSLNLQVVAGIQICHVDTLPQGDNLIGSADKGETVGAGLLPNIGAEGVVAMEEEKLDQSGSFKICDLNLVGTPEVTEIRDDPCLGQCSSAGHSMEPQNQRQVDFGTTVGCNVSGTDKYAQIPLDDRVVQVIDIEDDSPIEASGSDTSKAKSEMIYPSMENMMNHSVNTDILPGIQDGYSLAISDYLGADISCYQSIQSDLHAGMGLNDSEGITVMDDSIYGSFGDIGFMEVWDQPAQDYEKFF